MPTCKALKSTSGLFGVATSERPTRYSEAVIHAAADACWRSLCENDREFADYSPEDVAGSLESLRGALSGSSEDGYDICRDLERDGWTVDAPLVEHMDGGWLRSALDDAIRAWVQREGIVPRLEVGDKVTYELPRGLLGRREQKTGHVLRIERDRAQYVLSDGERFPHNGQGGWLKDFEEVETDDGAGVAPTP